jgi:hypothetical protein
MDNPFDHCWYGEPDWDDIDEEMLSEVGWTEGSPVPRSKHAKPRALLRFESDHGTAAQRLASLGRLRTYEQQLARKKVSQWTFSEEESEMATPTPKVTPAEGVER